MGIEGLDYKVIHIPLTAGLRLKDDPRAMNPPGLAVCGDARFDELGGIQTRLPFALLGNSILGGGTLANVRRLVANGPELVCMTDTAVYSWDARDAAWALRGTHLAVATSETPRFATNGDQTDGDRAELAGTVVFAWSEGTSVYAAAQDKSTGAVIVPPTLLSSATGPPRLVALSTRILLFVDGGSSGLTARAIDPASPATGITLGGSTVVAAGTFNALFDVVRIASQDTCVGACRRQITTSYSVFTVTAGLSVTASTKPRTCDGPIAVSAVPDASAVQVIRANGTNIEGDLIALPALGDTFTAQPVGSGTGTINQIAAAHRAVTNGGAFRCYAFWHSSESTVGATWESRSNWVDTANSRGAAARFVGYLGVGSRAFAYGSSVYVWMAFGGLSTANTTGPFLQPLSTQNTYFLYRDDAFLAAKCVAGSGGGLAPSLGRLPHVQLTDGSTGFTWCATRRRRFALTGDAFGFAARQPVEVAFTFDSNAARRTVRIGQTLYIAGGEGALQYDGVQLAECGFHIYPWLLSVIDAAAGGSVAAATYAYKLAWRWPNAQGESDRSTTATIGTVTVTGNSTNFVANGTANLTVTHKTSTPPAVELWRTAAAPTTDAPFYLVTSSNPTSTSNPNRYIANDPTTGVNPVFTDFESDATATANETHPENGAILATLAAPPASIIAASADRLFLWGIAGDPDRIRYSKLRGSGEVAAFNDSLLVNVPPAGGDAAGLALLNETLIAFRRRSVYALPGDGFANDGSGSNYGPARLLSADVGAVSHDAIVLTPQGLLFKSDKGWYLLDKGWNTRYVGKEVADFDGEPVSAAHIVEAYHQVRIVTSARILVWDYLVDAWTSWSISDAVHACVWNGTYYYLSSGNNGPMQEQTSFAVATGYGLDIEIGFLKPAELAGAVRVMEFQLVGEFRGACTVRLRTAYDFRQDGAGNWIYTDDIYWTPTPAVIGSVLQVSRGLSRGRCEAVKLRITASSVAKDGTPPTTEAIKLTGLAVKVGFRRTPYKRLPASQKV